MLVLYRMRWCPKKAIPLTQRITIASKELHAFASHGIARSQRGTDRSSSLKSKDCRPHRSVVCTFIRREQFSNLRRAAAFTDGSSVPSRLAFDGFTRYKSRRARGGPGGCSLDCRYSPFSIKGEVLWCSMSLHCNAAGKTNKIHRSWRLQATI